MAINDFKKTNLIGNELVALTKKPIIDDVVEIGMLSVKTANQTMEEAVLMPDPNPLWLSLWYEGEVSCLFSDTNLGKSILAVQIAEDIARKGKSVMYFDFELSAKQFQTRYTDESGNIYRFSDKLLRVEINSERLSVTGRYEDVLFEDIEKASLQLGVDVIVIDNLSYLCNDAEKGEAAGLFMKNLLGLKKKYGLSVLIIAHTPKRNKANPISQNDLAGSKRLVNFFDSVFAIGESAKDDKIRYIKQIKCRQGEFTYGSDNVIVCTIEMKNRFLCYDLETIKTTSESNHLKEWTNEDEEALRVKVLKLHEERKSLRQIASEVGVSKNKVARIINRG